MRWLGVANGLLLLLVALALAALEVAGRDEAGVEAAVQRYATAVGRGDLDAALAEIAPDQRATWAPWVQDQLGNVYEVRGTAVRAASPLDRLLLHAPGGPSQVSVVMDVDRGDPDAFYQATTRVGLERAENRWFLAAPLLATDQ